MPAAEVQQMMDDGLLPDSVVTAMMATATEGMNQNQANRFGKSLGMAQGMRAGVIEKRGDGYYAGNRKVAGEWKEPVKHENQPGRPSNNSQGPTYTVGYDNGFSRMMQKAGDWLNSWGTEASEPLDQAGQYLNENPDAALATCFGAAAVGTLLPFAVNTVPAWGAKAIAAMGTKKGVVNTVFGATTNTAAYLISEGSDATVEGALMNSVIGGATGFSASAVSKYLYDRAVAGAVNYISTGAVGGLGNAISQYANGESLSDLNWHQVAWSGVTYGFGSYVGTTFSRGASKLWGEVIAPNMATTGPAVFGSWMIDIHDRDRNNVRGNNR